MLGRIIQPVNLLLNLKSCSNAVIIGAQTIKLIINGNLKKVYMTTVCNLLSANMNTLELDLEICMHYITF